MANIHQWLTEAGFSAAWMQAYGTLIALAIAIWAPYHQHSREAKRLFHNQREYMQTAARLARAALKEAQSVVSEMSGDVIHHTGIATLDLHRHRSVLETVTLETLPDERAFWAIHSFRSEIDTLLAIAESLSQHLTPEGVPPDTLMDAQAIVARAEIVYQEFETAIVNIRR